MQKNNREKGKIGEEIACKYLESRGLEIICTNFRTAFGEIDIIAKEKDYVVFVEVKLRNGIGYGFPREAVGKSKQKNIINTALQFIEENNLQNIDFRFDVVEIIGKDKNIEYIKNAFWDWN